MHRFLLSAAIVGALTGCAKLEAIDRGLNRSSKAVAPTHPVYGTPVLDVVPEYQKVAQAQANGVERTLRRVAGGRRNHYGGRSEWGTRVAALFYSLIESAKLAEAVTLALDLK